jgi:hypothetical protein
MDMTSGTWLTDAYQATDQAYAGATSIKMPSAGSNSVRMRTDFQAVNGLAPTVLDTVLRASSVAAGRKAFVAIEKYNASKVLLGTDVILDAELTGANAWKVVRGEINLATTVRYLKYVFGKDASAGFDLWHGAYEAKRGTRRFRSYLSADQSIPNNTVTQLELDTEAFDWGLIFNSSAAAPAYQFTIADQEIAHAQHKVAWHFDALYVAENQSNNVIRVYICKNGAPGAGTILGYAENGVVTGTGEYAIPVSCDAELGGSDDVGVYVYQNAGAARDAVSGAEGTFFSGHEVQP